MSYIHDLETEPWRFDLFSILRHLERNNPDRPRVGDSSTLNEDYVRLGEDPYFDFPSCNVGIARRDDRGTFHLIVKYLGLLGPQGPMPLATTEEAYGWLLANDDSFARFLDLFNNRFLQLFFRAWADSRPIAHHDRPEADRFMDYVGSVIGIGTAPYKKIDSVPDTGKLAYAGLIAPRTKSASRLGRFLSGLFAASVDVHEFIGSWLPLDSSEWTELGKSYSTVGSDIVLGKSVYSVQDKARIRVLVADLAHYSRFLPTGDLCEPFADAVFFYVGASLDWEIELAIPARAAKPMKLGQSGELGWTSWISRDQSSSDHAIRADARFNPAERLRRGRAIQ